MVTLLSLIGIAAVFAGLAALTALLRGLSLKSATTDAVAAMLGTLSAISTSCLLFALYHAPDSAGLWRTVGSIALIMSPVTATIGLRIQGRRSSWRALIVSGIALLTVVAWLTLHLKGIRGGWGFFEIVAASGAA